VRQFDIVENLNSRTRSRYPLVVVLQHDTIAGIPTIVVAPLTPVSSTGALDRLHPIATVGGQTYRVIIEELAAVHRSSIGRMVTSLEHDRYALIRALDQLFTGI
jgi:toxin CcdB